MNPAAGQDAAGPAGHTAAGVEPAGAGGSAGGGGGRGDEPDVREALGLLLDAVVDQATAEAGARPARLALACPPTHVEAPAGPYAQLAADASDDVVLVDTAVAVAALVDHERGLPAGSTLGVLDLGGDVCDAALVRRSSTGFERVGRSFCGPGIGGWEVDTIVLEHVDAALGYAVSSQRGTPADGPAVLDRLRHGCRRAREQLLRAEDTVIQIGLPGMTARVRLTRVELERLIRPRLSGAVGTLELAIADAGLSAADLAGVVLVGGAARLPGAVGLAAGRLRRPVIVGSCPELTAALGAALVGASAAARPGGGPPPAPAAATTAGTVPSGPTAGPTAPGAAAFGAGSEPASPAGHDGGAPDPGPDVPGAVGPALSGHRFQLVEDEPDTGPTGDEAPSGDDAAPPDGWRRRLSGAERRRARATGRHRRSRPAHPGADAHGVPFAPGPGATTAADRPDRHTTPASPRGTGPGATTGGRGRAGRHGREGERGNRRLVAASLTLLVMMAVGGSLVAAAYGRDGDGQQPIEAIETSEYPADVGLPGLSEPAVPDPLGSTSSTGGDRSRAAGTSSTTTGSTAGSATASTAGSATASTAGSTTGSTGADPTDRDTTDRDTTGRDTNDRDPAGRAPAATTAPDATTTLPPTTSGRDRPGGPPDTARPARPGAPPTTPAPPALPPPRPAPTPAPEPNLLEELVGLLFEGGEAPG